MKTRSSTYTWLRLTAGLLVLSAILFAGGIALERRAHASREVAGIPQAAGAISALGQNAETPGTHQDADQAEAIPAEGAASTGQPGEALSETVLGIDLENPWLTIAFVLGSLVLAAALLRFGRRAVPLVILIAAAATILDVREVLFQVEHSNTGLALVAGAVALTHAAVVLLGILAWRTSRPFPDRSGGLAP